MGDNDTVIIGNYEDKIGQAVKLIVSAADELVGRTEAGRLDIAMSDVFDRIGLLMEKVSATEMRKEAKKDEGLCM